MAKETVEKMKIVNGIAFCPVPAGEFIRGSSSTPEESPKSRIYLDSYYISETPITNKLYSLFLSETSYRRPPLLESDQFGEDMQPVVGVSWFDAMEFCQWFSSWSEFDCTLPTEAQWEKASRGVDGRTYPWGESPPNLNLFNINKSVGKTTRVGSYNVRSPYGCMDMLGNTWEWCLDWFDDSYYSKADNQNPVQLETKKFKSIRGGSWRSDLFRATCAHRCFYHPNVRSDRHGFRIVLCQALK